MKDIGHMKKLALLFIIWGGCLLMTGCKAITTAGCCCTDSGKACAKASGPSSCGCSCNRCGKKK